MFCLWANHAEATNERIKAWRKDNAWHRGMPGEEQANIASTWVW